MSHDANTLWSRALPLLQGQMTRATFDTWIRGTAAELDGDVLTVLVRDDLALDWVAHRLSQIIAQTMQMLGHTGPIKYAIGAAPAPPNSSDIPTDATDEPPEASARPTQARASVELVEFDPTKRGWVQVGSYAIRFWMAYLGQGPFCLWLALRSFAQAGAAWPSITTLADIVANGDKQRLIGRQRNGKWVPGWLDDLERERLIWYKKDESGHYHFRVLDSLPLLTPTQTGRLRPGLQRAHDAFLQRANLDFEEWQQLTLPSLVGGEG